MSECTNGLYVLPHVTHLLLSTSVGSHQEQYAEQSQEDVEGEEDDDAAVDFDDNRGAFDEDGDESG